MELARASSVWVKPQVMRFTSLATRLLGSTSAGLSLGPALAFEAPQNAPMAAPVRMARRDKRDGGSSDLGGALRSDGCWTWLKVASPRRCGRAPSARVALVRARSRPAHLTESPPLCAVILSVVERFTIGRCSATHPPTRPPGPRQEVAGNEAARSVRYHPPFARRCQHVSSHPQRPRRHRH